MEDVIHHCLEGCQAVRKAKEHDLWLKEPSVGVECSLPLITFPNSDAVETPLDIQLGEVFGTSELGDEWNWVMVFDCDGVQGSVVLDKSEQAILLLDEEDWRCHWRLGWMNPPSAEVFLKEGIELYLFLWGEQVDLAISWLRPRFQLNRVVPWFLRWKCVKCLLGEDIFRLL